MPPGLKQLRTSSGLQQQQQNHHHHHNPTSTLSPLTQYTNHHRLPNHHQPPHHPSSHHHPQNNHHHQQQQQHQFSTGENGVSNGGGGGRFSCPYTNCDKSFDDLTKFKEHNRSHQSLKPFHCRYGRCSATSSKKGNLRRHIRQVHKSVRPVDADQYIEEDRETLKAEEEIFRGASSSSSPGNGGTNSSTAAAISNGLDLQQILVNHGDSSFDSSSDFDSSDVLTLAAELCITALPGVNAASSSSSSSTAKGESEILPASATAAQFSTILRTAGGQYLCPFAGGCTSAFYDVSHLKIHYRVHTALLPYRCTWPELATSAAAVSSSCRFESTRKGNVVRHIRARHLIEPGQRQLSSVDPFDYVSTRTAWIKWEDAMFERATVLSITEFQQQQQQQLQQQQQQQQQQQMMMMSKKKSSPPQELHNSTAGTNERQNSSKLGEAKTDSGGRSWQHQHRLEQPLQSVVASES
ncbi:hypothetical protein TYRP_011437 [Tyrophagus putrescentiae]|nr:hypothetical protein TYRP_011437 [Tyrophagus putrescentiae]